MAVGLGVAMGPVNMAHSMTTRRVERAANASVVAVIVVTVVAEGVSVPLAMLEQLQRKGITPLVHSSFEQHKAATRMISSRMCSPNGLGQGVTIRG